MSFFRDSGVSAVLEYPQGTLSSCIAYTLWSSALASCVALPRECVPDILYLLHPWSRLASMQSCAQFSDAHGCANAAKTWMSKSGLALTKKILFVEAPI